MSEVTEFPDERNLDGVYYRVNRNGQYVSRCFSDLTESEQEKIMAGYDAEQLRRLCHYLYISLRKVGDELDLYRNE